MDVLSVQCSPLGQLTARLVKISDRFSRRLQAAILLPRDALRIAEFFADQSSSGFNHGKPFGVVKYLS